MLNSSCLRALCCAAAIALHASAALAQRTFLTAPTTFKLSQGGSDAGDCTVSACQSALYLWHRLTTSYDLGGQAVTITIDHTSTYAFCSYFNGLVVGQTTPIRLTADSGVATIQPDAGNCPGGNIYALGIGNGASFIFDHFSLGMAGTQKQDTVAIGPQSYLEQGASVTFGQNMSFNDVSINGTLVIDSSYSITKPLYVVGGTCTNGSPNVTGVPSGQMVGLELFMRVVPEGYFSVTPGRILGFAPGLGIITLNANYAAPSGPCTLAFHNGGQCHHDYGTGAVGQMQTNGVPNLITVSIANTPDYIYAFHCNAQNSNAQEQAIWWQGGVTGQPYLISTNAVTDTHSAFMPTGESMGVLYMPGNFAGAAGSWSYNTFFITLAAPAGAYGIYNGALINSYSVATCNTATGSTALNCGITIPGFAPNCPVIAPGVPYGTVVQQDLGGGNYTMSNAAVTGVSGVTFIFTNVGGVQNGSYVTSSDPSSVTITISRPTTQTQSGFGLLFGGTITTGGQLN